MTTPRQNHRKSDKQAELIKTLTFLRKAADRMADQAPPRSTGEPCRAPVHRLPLPGREPVESPPGRGQGGVPSRRAVPPRRGFNVTDRSLSNERVPAFYNRRGAAERHIKEGKYALNWTRLSCMRLAANVVRLQRRALACNFANSLRTPATPEGIERRSPTSLRERPIKTGARMVRHARYAIFHMTGTAARQSRASAETGGPPSLPRSQTAPRAELPAATASKTQSRRSSEQARDMLLHPYLV